MKTYPFYLQSDAMDCGPTCLRMVAKFHGKNFSLQSLREISYISRTGVSMLAISDVAESIGFRSIGVNIDFEKLAKEAPLPCIVHWKQKHFVVVYDIQKRRSGTIVTVGDPARGIIKFTREEFEHGWISTRKDGEERGLVLILNPTPLFHEQAGEETDRRSIKFILRYLRPHKKFILQLILGMILGSLLQLLFPFLTQAVVDKGIGNQNLGFVTLILIAQLVLFAGKMSVDFLRSWIILHITTRINISLISDFLIKLMKLPIGFFDTKLIGDIMQRIGDHTRIQNFLTGSSLATLFSLVNLVIFGVVLAVYDLRILTIFLIGNTLYILWILIFLGKRRELDYKRFALASGNQSTLFQLITGMQEIKLNNAEKQKRWRWEIIQANLFRINIKSLALGQYQQVGSLFLSQTTSIFISFLAARAVIHGEISLGMMMAITYIVGQITSPIDQMIGFIQSLQDAKISLERLGEIHQKEDEEPSEKNRLTSIPDAQDIIIRNVTFRYEGPRSPAVLDDVTLDIPYGKITAIVGASGSGKTTLIKLILGFYKPESGEIKIGAGSLENINGAYWRSKCGAVMQDGFIFSETIAENIAPGFENIDTLKLSDAAKAANIDEYILSLPLNYNTKIGQEGSGLSQGQKQRLLIARAVYKDPEYVFFDEATNALDANNELAIMENLDKFFKGRTVVVVAHRLSTVKNADQIIVLEKGKVVEKGDHNTLTDLKGSYYHLVKNQLELGN
jgi:ATP-binding cassette, subfamily B, bacterial